jgi:hypothetical protein
MMDTCASQRISGSQPAPAGAASGPAAPRHSASALDLIPVRLPQGRRAFLQIPTPFYESDKLRLINQINLLLTDDGEVAW